MYCWVLEVFSPSRSTAAEELHQLSELSYVQVLQDDHCNPSLLAQNFALVTEEDLFSWEKRCFQGTVESVDGIWIKWPTNTIYMISPIYKGTLKNFERSRTNKISMFSSLKLIIFNHGFTSQTTSQTIESWYSIEI